MIIARTVADTVLFFIGVYMALVLYRNTDILKFKIGDITICFSPLNIRDKTLLLNSGAKLQASDNQVEDSLEFSKTIIRMTVKAIENVELTDGTPLKLEIENGQLTDESLDDVMYLPVLNEVIAIASSLLQSTPKDEFIKDAQGNVLEGVKYLKKTATKK